MRPMVALHPQTIAAQFGLALTLACTTIAPTARALPKFAAVPTPDEVAAVFPARALADRVYGRATVSCVVTADAGLASCEVKSETPEGYGFGAAAIAIAQKVRLKPDELPARLDLPMRFDPPPPPERAPVFQTASGQYRYLGGPGPYWPERAARMGIEGEAVIDCRTSDKGALSSCIVVSETPSEAGFSDAALRMAQKRWMTVAPLDVASAWVRVRVPFRLARK